MPFSASAATRPSVLVYRSFYGQLSETFVRDHVLGLKLFTPLVLANRVDWQAIAKGTELTVVPAGSRLARLRWQYGWACDAHRLLRKTRPALIHAHFLFDGAAILPYARRHGIPLVVTAHGYDATLRPESLAALPEGRILLARQPELAAYVSRFLCVSDFIRDELATRGYPADKLVSQPLGIDTATIRPPAEDASRKGIVTVGRLTEKKGTRFLIDAYARLPSRLRALHPLTIIGDGYLREALEAQAAQLGVPVKFTGASLHNDILKQVAAAALFCFPSVRAATGDAEGMGIAIMEALALGTPVVLFDGQPAAPILHAADAGVVVRAGDVAALADALVATLDDSASSLAMAARGRRLSEDRFDLACNVAKVERIYEEVLAT